MIYIFIIFIQLQLMFYSIQIQCKTKQTAKRTSFLQSSFLVSNRYLFLQIYRYILPKKGAESEHIRIQLVCRGDKPKLKKNVIEQKINGQFQGSFIKCCLEFVFIISPCCNKFYYKNKLFSTNFQTKIDQLCGIFMCKVKKPKVAIEGALFFTGQNDLTPEK